MLNAVERWCGLAALGLYVLATPMLHAPEGGTVLFPEEQGTVPPMFTYSRSPSGNFYSQIF